MRVGTINFGTDFSNFKDCYLDWLIEKKPVVLSCRICGMKLAPFVEHVGPRNAGWVKVQGRYGGYICHQCYGHGMHMTHEGLDMQLNMIKENNSRVKMSVRRYLFNHPWVKAKYR